MLSGSSYLVGTENRSVAPIPRDRRRHRYRRCRKLPTRDRGRRNLGGRHSGLVIVFPVNLEAEKVPNPSRSQHRFLALGALLLVVMYAVLYGRRHLAMALG